MKKFLLIIMVFILTSCSSVTISEYVPDIHPYQRKYYAGFNHVLEASQQALKDFGWKIEKTVDPAIYELVDEDISQRVLLITEPRSFKYGIGSHQSRLNIRILAGKGNTTDVEARYLSLNKVGVKQLRGYEDDDKVELILYRIGELLK
jgi:hypothetical protein